MKTDFAIPGYGILGYTDKDKEELQKREDCIKAINGQSVTLNLKVRTPTELKQSRCKAYKYLIP